MKKLFLLIPALVLALMTANAATHEIGSGTSNILGSTLSSADDGDVIILTDNGPYVNVKGSHDYSYLNKNLTILAADGKTPVIQFEVPFRSTGGKTVKFIGITFDGTSLTGYDYYFRFNDANNNNLEFEDCEFQNISKYAFDVYTAFKANSLKLTNCKLHDISSRGILNRGTLTYLEINGGQIYNFTANPVLDNYDGATLGKVKINGTEFYGNAKDIINGVPTSHADSCIINNCYFHNNSRSAVYFQASSVSGVETCDGVIVKNSTFANNDLSASDRSVIEVQNYGGTEAANIEVTVDHCTFYNNTTVNYDYSCVRSRKSTKVNITNSIFAYPTAIEFYATNCYGGTISNTVVYNLNKGHRSSGGAPAVTNTFTANPLFNDLANNKYTYDGDWVTPSISPARGAATDGSDLGDPRWYSDEILPSSDFASPGYTFLGTKAQLSGSFALNGDNCIQSQDKTYAGIAKWKIQATRKCIVEVTLNIAAGNTSGHRYEVALYDADNELVGTALAEPSNSWSAGDKVLGTYEIPAAGNYTVKLTNDCDNSSTIIEGVKFSYVGGDVQNMPGTTDIGDAWFSADGTRADGKIDFPNGKIQDNWVKWNVSFASAGSYNVTVNVNSDNCKNYTVALLDADGNNAVTPLSKSDCSTKGTPVALEMGAMIVPAGNYVLKVTNSTKDSDAELISVEFAAAGGGVVDLPGTIPFSEAMLSPKAHVTDGNLWFNKMTDSDPVGQWARWNVTTDHNGTFLFTMGVESSNEQSYKISIYNDGDELVDFFETASLGSGSKTVKHYFNLVAGDYAVKVENTYSWSLGHLTSLVVTEPDDLLTLDEEATSTSAWSAKVGDENTYNVKIIRTLKGGMYNTLVLPFAISSSQGKEIFGSDVMIYTLDEGTVGADNVLYLTLSAPGTSTYQGTPVFIKPSRDIVNPVFSEVEFKAASVGTTTRTNANLAGSFVKTTLSAGSDILFLAANDMLYYPTADIDILGMRAWFVIHGVSGGAAPIRRARFIEQGENMATDVEVIGGAMPTEFGGDNVRKLIEDGQLLIIRDGVQYNTLGVRVK